MIGDKLVIEPHHTERAKEVGDLVEDRLDDKYVVTVAGESGSGKSELAAEIVRELSDRGHAADMIQQDDYFVFPPKTNHEMRRNNIEQVGPYEVKLDFMDANLRSFKRNESPIYKPLVVYDDDRITREEKATDQLQVLVAEGTYTSTLEFADFRVFIDRDYHQTKATREKRARDVLEPFIQDVLEREHQIIAQHKARADAVITSDFAHVEPAS